MVGGVCRVFDPLSDDDSEFSAFWQRGGSVKMRDQFWHYLLLVGAAWLGIIARFGQWWDGPAFNWRKALSEILTAPAIGLFTGGVAKHWSPDADPMIVGALAALFGLLGTTALQALALKFFEKKIGL